MSGRLKPYRVCLFGCSFDTGNRGVSALAASLVKLIVESRPSAQVSLLIGSRHPRIHLVRVNGQVHRVPIVNYRLSPRSSLREHLGWILLGALVHRLMPIPALRTWLESHSHWLSALRRADFVGDIRGGDSFSDIYGLGRLILGGFPALTAWLLDKRLVLLPQTYGPFRHPLSIFLARRILRYADVILSRDRDSVRTVQALVAGAKVRFCPDVAFTLEPAAPERWRAEPELDLDKARPLIGLNVNGLIFNGGYTRRNMFGLKFDYKAFLPVLLEGLLRQTPAHILLVPHAFGPPGSINSDRDAIGHLHRQAAGKYEGRLHALVGEYDQSGLKALIGLCDFFIGSRLHACIAALSQGIPTVALSYSDKFSGVFSSAGIAEMVVDGRTATPEQILARSVEMFERRGEVAPPLRRKAARLQGETRRVFRELVG